jgi:hypothetical protein
MGAASDESAASVAPPAIKLPWSRRALIGIDSPLIVICQAWGADGSITCRYLMGKTVLSLAVEAQKGRLR